MQCVRGVVGKGRNHGPDQSKALYSVRVLLGGGPELVGSMISVSGLVSWMQRSLELNGLKRLMVSGAFGRWSFWSLVLRGLCCERVSGTFWSLLLKGLWSFWSPLFLGVVVL